MVISSNRTKTYFLNLSFMTNLISTSMLVNLLLVTIPTVPIFNFCTETKLKKTSVSVAYISYTNYNYYFNITKYIRNL